MASFYPYPSPNAIKLRVVASVTTRETYMFWAKFVPQSLRATILVLALWEREQIIQIKQAL
jgi:hypothetical protein